MNIHKNISFSRGDGFPRPALFFCLFLAAIILSGPLAGAATEEYIVGEGDVLEITVYDNPDMTTVARVDEEGQILFPFLGKLYVGGFTVNRVKTVVTARLADGYLVAPKVTVFVKEFRGKKAAIIGAVRRPGLYTLKGEATFLELLSLSGGLTERAGPEAVVKRDTPSAEKGEKRISIDLVRLVGEGDTTLDIQLMDGDSVYIGTAGEITVTGEVHRPGTFTYEKGMILETAIALAGGFTLDASKENISITRKIDGREEVLKFVYNDRLLLSPVEEDDRIHVPDLGVFYVTGEVMRPGEYRFERGTTVIKAVTRAGGFGIRASKGRMKIRRKVNNQDAVIKKVHPDDPVLPGDVLDVPESFF